jgi:hypothetical protein
MSQPPGYSAPQSTRALGVSGQAVALAEHIATVTADEDDSVQQTTLMINQSSVIDKQQANGLKSVRYAIKKTYSRLERKYDCLVIDHCTYEVIGIVLCISALAAIIAILSAYQDRPFPCVVIGVSVRCQKIMRLARLIDNEVVEYRHIYPAYILKSLSGTRCGISDRSAEVASYEIGRSRSDRDSLL